MTPLVDRFKRMPRGTQIRNGLTMTEVARQLEAHCHAMAEAADRRAALQAWRKYKREFTKLTGEIK